MQTISSRIDWLATNFAPWIQHHHPESHILITLFSIICSILDYTFSQADKHIICNLSSCLKDYNWNLKESSMEVNSGVPDTKSFEGAQKGAKHIIAISLTA
jgi:hypothetical protein